jgi:predicted ATPase/DNA-binding XRE family transcriptional regulator
MADSRQGSSPSRPSDSGEEATIASSSFGALLRQYRLAAGLSQEALAERANLSARAIRSLEHGDRHSPYRDTVEALVAALSLAGPERVAFEAAVSRSRGQGVATPPVVEGALVALPLPPSPLIDRGEELDVALGFLRGDTVRLVTPTGPGGVGKTRLALEVAHESRAAFPDGVWFFDLSSIRDPELVLPTIAQAFGLQEHGTRSPLATLQAHLQARHTLLVLDNFEQVLAAAPHLAELLAVCPRLRLLVTSRARLRLRWEHVLPVPPLPLPDPDAPPTTEELAALPAVALFVERAQASSATFALTATNGPAVATLCRHLEGLPLALELAAARANVLAPSQMLTWAEHRLPVLGWEAPDLPTRQRSLRATLAWSYALLPAAEQALFRRLAVFADGWTHEAAEAVTDMRELGLEPLEGLARLCDASLIQARPGDDEQRFGWLETVREFAAEQLESSGEALVLERQHAAYYLALAERAAPALRGPEQGAWSHRLQREHANLRAALGWAAREDEAESELRLASSLVDFWWQHGYWQEGQAWLDDALTRCPDRRDGPRQHALQGLGLLTAYLGDYAVGATRLEEALTLAQELGDERRFALTLGWLGVVAYLHGQIERWPALAAQLEAARPRMDPQNLNFALTGLGLLAHEAGEQRTARVYLEEALAGRRREGNEAAVATVLGGLVLVAQAQGDWARAVGLLTAGLQLAQEVGYPRVLARYADIALGVTAAWATAATLARLLGAADAQRARASFPLSPRHQAGHDRLVAGVRTELGEDAFAAGWAAGRALSVDELVEETLAALAACPADAGGQ